MPRGHKTPLTRSKPRAFVTRCLSRVAINGHLRSELPPYDGSRAHAGAHAGPNTVQLDGSGRSRRRQRSSENEASDDGRRGRPNGAEGPARQATSTSRRCMPKQRWCGRSTGLDHRCCRWGRGAGGLQEHVAVAFEVVERDVEPEVEELTHVLFQLVELLQVQAPNLGVELVAVEDIILHLRCQHHGAEGHAMHAEDRHLEVRVALDQPVDENQTDDEAFHATTKVGVHAGHVLPDADLWGFPAMEAGEALRPSRQRCHALQGEGQA
mmetsp:Transcript_16093/g.51531  ORF Transcript_16093/g.51531 Transcript_16093/m.51531 type:complete len:267 (+) Transcript_16093:232-1032(+)